MSDAFELCVRHFHFMLENFLFDIKTLDSVIKKMVISLPKFGTFLTTHTFCPLGRPNNVSDNLSDVVGQNVGHKE